MTLLRGRSATVSGSLTAIFAHAGLLALMAGSRATVGEHPARNPVASRLSATGVRAFTEKG